MKIIICGSRGFDDYKLLCDVVNKFITDYSCGDIEIISGGAKGADKLAEKYAFEHGYKKTVFQAEWDAYGKSAGPIRNKKMAEYGDHVIAFWDGNSKGTKNMIELAKKHNIQTILIKHV